MLTVNSEEISTGAYVGIVHWNDVEVFRTSADSDPYVAEDAARARLVSVLTTLFTEAAA